MGRDLLGHLSRLRTLEKPHRYIYLSYKFIFFNKNIAIIARYIVIHFLRIQISPA